MSNIDFYYVHESYNGKCFVRDRTGRFLFAGSEGGRSDQLTPRFDKITAQEICDELNSQRERP